MPNDHTYCYYNGVQVTEANDWLFSSAPTKRRCTASRDATSISAPLAIPTVWRDPNAGCFRQRRAQRIGVHQHRRERRRQPELCWDGSLLRQDGDLLALSCQLWFLDPDPSLNQYFQTLRDAGTHRADQRAPVRRQRCLFSGNPRDQVAPGARPDDDRRCRRRRLAHRPADPGHDRAKRAL